MSLDDEINKLRLRAKDLKRGVFSTFLPIRPSRSFETATEKQRDRAVLDKHSKSLAHELKSLQALLRCECEGVGPDRLLFRFWHVDPRDAAREFNFALDLSGDAYKGECNLLSHPPRVVTRILTFDMAVLASRPVLPSMTTLVDELNETKDVYTFLLRVRMAFADLVVPDT